MAATAESVREVDLSEPLYDAQEIHGNRKKGIKGELPMSPSTYWARVASGVFPPGHKFGSRRYWTSSELREMKRTILSGNAP